MKRRIFWSVFFTVFFRLPIYESIAAIFWQSAIFVLYLYFWCEGWLLEVEDTPTIAPPPTAMLPPTPVTLLPPSALGEPPRGWILTNKLLPKTQIYTILL